MRLSDRAAGHNRLVSTFCSSEGGGRQEPHVPRPCSVDFRQSREQKDFLQFEHWTLLPTLPLWQLSCPLVQGGVPPFMRVGGEREFHLVEKQSCL